MLHSEKTIVEESLLTQSRIQHQPNPMELRSMDSCIQISCRFLKCQQNVPPPSLLSNEKSSFEGVKGDLSILRSDGGGTFH